MRGHGSIPTAVAAAFATFPVPVRDRLLHVRDLIFDTASQTDGVGALEETLKWGEPAYLTQSGQLYNEANAAAHGKVYCFGPTFRAEKSKTRRHLTEFWMVEPEAAFAHLEDAVRLAEGLICHVVGYVLETRKEELKTLERDVAKLEKVQPPFPWLHYDDAIKLIQSKGSETKWGSDFGGTDETVIAEAHDRPVVVHRFPAAIKAFYMEPDPKDAKYSLSADILAPEGYGEIVGGGERMSSAESLLKAIYTHELPEEAAGAIGVLRARVAHGEDEDAEVLRGGLLVVLQPAAGIRHGFSSTQCSPSTVNSFFQIGTVAFRRSIA